MRKLIFVDSEPEIHHELDRILGLAQESAGDGDGYQVDHASSGEEGAAKVRDAVETGLPYALALVGVVISGTGDGLDAVERMWRIDRHLQVVLCLDESDSAPEAIRQRFGASDRILLLRKPLCAMELVQAVHTLSERAHAEKAMREREERLELAIEGADAGLWDWDLATNRIYLSPRWKRMLGHEDDEIGSSIDEWTSRLHPDDAERAISAAQAFSEGRRHTYEVEFRMKHRDGHYVAILSRGLALRDEEGKLVRLVGTHVDVTVRKEVEEALRESEERFRALTENSPDIIMRFDREHRHLYVNPAVERQTGIPWQDFIGKTHAELGFPEDLVRLWDEAIEGVFLTGEMGQVEFQLPDGTWIDWQLVPELSSQGEVKAVATSARDITKRKGAEQALRESEEKYRALADSLPVTIFESDPEGRFTFVNRHGLEFNGYTAGDLDRGVSTPDVVAPEGHERLLKNMARVIEYGEVPPEEYEIVKRDGSRYPATIYARSITSGGQPSGLRGVVIDITERRRAEEALREREATFRSIMDSAQDGIIAIDNDGKITLWNRAATRLFGWEAEEVIGRDCHELLAPERYADARMRGFAAFQSSGQGSAVGRINPLTARHKDGTEFPVELSLASLELGGRWCAVGIVRDVTERKRAEEALRESEERFRAILDAVQAGIIVVDPVDHAIRYTNPVTERMIGLDRDKIVGRVCHHFVCPAEQGRCPITDLGQTVETSERVLLTAEGREVPILKTVTTVMLEGREHLLESFVDYTELRRVQDELAATHRELVETARRVGMAEVATGVLHNVGNALNSVGVTASSMAKLIRDSRLSYLDNVVGTLEEHADDLAEFITSDERGRRLPTFIAELARSLAEERRVLLESTDKLSGHVAHITEIISLQQSYSRGSGLTEPVLLSELMEDAVRMHDQAILRHSITVEREYASSPATLVDRSKVLQILSNLISNAKDALSRSGRDDKGLTLRIRAPEDGKVRIEVEDNGAGIAEEDLTRIFSFGFTTRKDGHGFGLHSGALAAKEMGGALTAHSDGPGKGAVFRLDLPLVTEGGADES